jgi:alkylation response protein AidB-like acyl-CoA dehydrogenase
VSIVRAGHLPDPGAFGGASLARARYALACELLGVAGRLRDLTVEHISTRHQFGAPLSARQVVRHRMADVEVAVGAASAVIASATFGDPVAAAVAKACAGRAAVLAAEWALQHHGAMGFSAEHSVGDTVRHAYLLDGLLGSSAQLIGALGGHLRRTTDPTLFRPGEAE